MALYSKLQSWIGASNSGVNLDAEVDNIYATLVDLDTNKIESGASIAALTVTTLTNTTLNNTTSNTTNLTSTNAVIQRPSLHVRDSKASGTDGGSFTSGAYRTRDLNTTERNTITGASVAANQFILPVGKYIISSRAPAVLCGTHKTRIQNITDGTTLVVGSVCREGTTGDGGSDSIVRDFYFEIAGTKTFELQHRCTTTRATNGFGYAATFGDAEIFAEIFVQKVG